MKQINPFLNNQQKSTIYRSGFYILLIYSVLVTILMCKGKEMETIDVVIPEKKMEFEVKEIKDQKTVYVPKIVRQTVYEKDYEYIDSLAGEYQSLKDEMDFLLDRYAYEMDSIKKQNAFADAITIREFSQPFENDFVKINNTGLVQGKLLSLKNEVTLKERTEKASVERKRKIQIGGGAGINEALNQGYLSGSISFNTKNKGYHFDYTRLNNQNYFGGKIMFDLINF